MIDQILSYIITIVTRIRKQTLSQSAKVFDVGSGHFSLANLFRDLKTSFKIIRDHAVTRINFGFFELRRKFVLFSMKSNKTQMRNTIPKINDCAEGNKSNIHFFLLIFNSAFKICRRNTFLVSLMFWYVGCATWNIGTRMGSSTNQKIA